MTTRAWMIVLAAIPMALAGERVARAQQLGPVTTMTVNVGTGADNLRGSSHAMLSVRHPDGTWSSERDISTGGTLQGIRDCDACGCEKFPAESNTYGINISNWDGIDPCAQEIRVRLQQGACFLATDDNWNLAWLTIDINTDTQFGSFRLAAVGPAYLTGSQPTDTQPAFQTPAGVTCANGLVADCSGNPFDPAVNQGPRAFDQDSQCDDGPSTGYNFMCEAFLFDSGACGIPPGWTCPAAYYGDGWCDCTDCGVWDPDCNDPSINQTGNYIFDCAYGSVCVNQQIGNGDYNPTCVVPAAPPR